MMSSQRDNERASNVTHCAPTNGQIFVYKEIDSMVFWIEDALTEMMIKTVTVGHKRVNNRLLDASEPLLERSVKIVLSMSAT